MKEKYIKQYLKLGAFVEKTVHVHPTAHIGIGCIILGNTTIGEEASILPYSVIENSHIASHATIGPFAHLRGGTVVEQLGKVGAFVETKKCKIGAQSKVPHLAYVGDAEIGEKCNIGCGVVVCNYDGEKKHKTKIGNRVFIGSNCNLVAPIEIGDDCFTAAGSTITQNMPNNTFAKARSKQENKPNKKTLKLPQESNGAEQQLDDNASITKS